jgi:hypothetical protein
MVTSNNEVRGAVVLADDCVPDGFARTGHTHSKGQQTDDGHAVRVSGEESLVHAHAGEVIDISGLGEADNGVDKHVGLPGAGGTNSELSVGAMHWVSAYR